MNLCDYPDGQQQHKDEMGDDETRARDALVSHRTDEGGDRELR